MKLSNENVSTKPNISLEGKMSTKDAGKVAIILAYGKSISWVLCSLAGVITAVTALIWKVSG